ncbi:MAG: hypothetical protein ACK41T_11365 [Pseudobdellovibrio sp.]
MINFLENSRLIFFALSLLILSSCQKSELEDIKNAQLCLNKAAPSQAQACVAKIASDNSPQANQLKCAAYFIEEGYGSPTALIDAIAEAENNDPTCVNCADSVQIISVLAFTNTTQANNAFNVCNASKVTIYTLLSSLVQVATLAKNLNPAASTPAEYAIAIHLLNNTDIGQIVTTTYQNSCVVQSSNEALKDYCTVLSDAISAGSVDNIGACFKYKLTNGGTPTGGIQAPPPNCPTN